MRSMIWQRFANEDIRMCGPNSVVCYQSLVLAQFLNQPLVGHLCRQVVICAHKNLLYQ